MRSALSARQEECLRLTAFRTDREIAVVLGISEATVKKHVHEACQRLGVKRRKAALALLTASRSRLWSDRLRRPIWSAFPNRPHPHGGSAIALHPAAPT